MRSPLTPAERAEARRDCLDYRRRHKVPADRDVHVFFDENDDLRMFVRDRRVHRRATAAEDRR